MVELKVEFKAYHKDELVEHLHYVADQINQGYSAGHGWFVDGEDEEDE